MDRNTILGIVIIAGIFITYGIISRPDKEQLRSAKLAQDSIELVNKKLELERQIQEIEAKQNIRPDSATTTSDSIKIEQQKMETGVFGANVVGVNKMIVLENDKIKIEFSEKGGRPYSVSLKEYKTYDSLPVKLFEGDSNSFGMNFYSQNRHINTNELFFKSLNDTDHITVTNEPDTVIMRLSTDSNSYIEYRYSLVPGKYMLDMEIRLSRLNNISTQRNGIIDIDWQVSSPQQEKGRDNELQYTTLYYKPFEEDVDYLRTRSKKEAQTENITTQVEWIAFKDQFFASVIMADKSFSDAVMSMETLPKSSQFLKRFKSSMGLAYSGKEQEVIPLHFYFGPNKYKLLKKNYGDKKLQDLVTVGRGIIKWINQIVIISLFEFLSRFISNYGIIILVMTIIIKIFLLPLTFKSYLSTAKMKVLKPQVDEINNKIPKDKPLERQQASMSLYKKAGVSPLGGCIPMILQMPILFAMFRFFPTSIELRQQSFLWAHDLSTYDSIFEWSATIPILSSFYGNHISLFTLLMTVSTIISMKFNSQANTTNQQMPGMQTMMYVMPVMFMFILNKFSAGLTYYYFLANMITIGQNYLFKQFIDEDELLKKLESKKTKPAKKSGFQQRLEKIAKQKGYKLPKR